MADAAQAARKPARSKSELFVEKAAKLRLEILGKLDDLAALAKYNAHTPAHVEALFGPIAARVEKSEEAFKAPITADDLPPLVPVADAAPASTEAAKK